MRTDLTKSYTQRQKCAAVYSIGRIFTEKSQNEYQLQHCNGLGLICWCLLENADLNPQASGIQMRIQLPERSQNDHHTQKSQTPKHLYQVLISRVLFIKLACFTIKLIPEEKKQLWQSACTTYCRRQNADAKHMCKVEQHFNIMSIINT